MVLTPTGPGLALLLVSVVLLPVSWFVVALRMWVRYRIRSVGFDDYLMLVGLVLFTAACQATITGSMNGVGASPDRITEHYEQRGRMWFMLFQLFYVLSTVPIKASICVALIRVTPRKLYRWILYTVMALTAVAAVVTDVAVLAWCKPVAATWDPSAGKCAAGSVITNVSYFISAVSILTDWTCAILPAIILWDVQLQFRIKLPVMIILGLGFVASAATLVRLRYLVVYNRPDKYLLNVAHIAIWSIAESGLGLIAGSMATLRPLLKYMPCLGSVSPSRRAMSQSRRNGVRPQSTRPPKKALPYRGDSVTETTCEGAGRDTWERLSEAESQRNTTGSEAADHANPALKGGITVTTDISYISSG